MKIQRKYIATGIAVIAFSLLTASCGSSRKATNQSYPAIDTPNISTDTIITIYPASNAVASLIQEAQSWIGTKYRYGGNDRNGVDCSGFVLQVFNHALGIKLPRTSTLQHQFCDSISRSMLQPGDLLFFTVRGGRKVGHVGIYIGDDKMIHASTSRGVIISSISQRYYTDNFYGAGRVKAIFTKSRNNKRYKIDPIIITTKSDTIYNESDSGLEDTSEFFD